ncbi:MAG: hypothetical protein HC836_12515 [Richelia sp. RM2_1_2]|nr:hypothetical protein [Richelia sp. RM2_1_2]
MKAKVVFLSKKLYDKVRKEADKKFKKNSYVKNLWVLNTYKRRGGKVRQSGKKPTTKDIQKQISGNILYSVDLFPDVCEVELNFSDYQNAEFFDSCDDQETNSDLEFLINSNFDNESLATILFCDASEKEKFKKTLNKPFRLPTDSNKKFGVYVKNDKGNIVLVKFGDPKMEIRRDNLKARRNFRSRHNCSNPGPKWKPRYWSCRMWSAKPVSEIVANINLETYKNCLVEE